MSVAEAMEGSPALDKDQADMFTPSQLRLYSPVGEGWKTLTVGHRLKVISRIQGKIVARNFCSFSSEALQPL